MNAIWVIQEPEDITTLFGDKFPGKDYLYIDEAGNPHLRNTNGADQELTFLSPFPGGDIAKKVLQTEIIVYHPSQYDVASRLLRNVPGYEGH